MNENPLDRELQQLLQGSLSPMETRPRRDLWPQLSARLGERERRSVRIRLKWWEWALAAGDLGAAFYAPDAIPALLYHL
jgi:hypothetical protein